MADAIAPYTTISAINVEGLFDLFDYDLCVKNSSESSDLSRLLILYGDNGSGKTTILKMVFHLLSSEDEQGHRTFLAGIPFRRFSVSLGGTTTVEADRPDKNRIGTYRFRITRDSELLAEATLPANEQYDVRVYSEGPAIQKAWSRALEVLKSLQLALYYLPDDRKAEGPLSTREDSAVDDYYEYSRVVHRQLLYPRDVREQRHPIESAVKGAEEWIRAEALRAASIGEADTNKIYADIVKRLAKSRGARATADASSKLIGELSEIQARSRSFSTLGLMSPLDVSEILKILEKASPQKQQMISDVLRPYVTGLDARLKAMQTIQELIRAFLEGINRFFANKEVSFDLSAGIEIRSRTGETLSPGMLSSGEKQLLLLFCNTVTARQSAGIFIIDEPEISLNVKWQRQLLRALLNLVRGTRVQFLVATHSIELLAQFRANVLQLKNIDEHVG